MFLALFFKMKIKAFIKYYTEESRQEDWEIETFIRSISENSEGLFAKPLRLCIFVHPLQIQ